MHHREFLTKVDRDQVIRALREAERKTSGQVRVFVSHHKVADALSAARRQFSRLGMTKTRERNGVLLFLAPKSQTFSIFGDVTIDQRCGTARWHKLRDEIIPHLKEGRYTEALVHGITNAGDILAEYFPAKAGATNELIDRRD